MSQLRDDHVVRPLNARSVVLSALLGYHPPELPVSALVRIGGLFDIAEGAIRVALTRMVADGDLVTEHRTYRLSGRLLDRQRRQDESCSPSTRKWRGDWEMEVVTTAQSRGWAERVALRRALIDLRLAELREGTWIRPANLIRPRHETALEQCTFFKARPNDPVGFARSLWDLDEWADGANNLYEQIARSDGLVEGFFVAAAVFHHLQNDPVLPPELLPEDWPGERLRECWAGFRESYAEMLRDYGQQ